MKRAIIILIVLFIVSLIIILLIDIHITPHELFCKKFYNDVYIEQKIYDDLTDCELIIAMPVYNVNIKTLRRRIEYLTQGIRKWSIFLYGLDSSNIETINDLLLWKSQSHNVKLVEKLSQTSAHRTIRIAQIRNTILKTISIENSVGDNAYILVYDGDHVGPMSKNGLIDSIIQLEMKDELFAISACGTITVIPGFDLMYDSFAYRGYNEGDRFPLLYSSIINIYSRVRSSFSGACLYRWRELKNYRYPLDSNVCEHVSLNLLMCKELNKYMVMSKLWRINIVFGQNSVL